VCRCCLHTANREARNPQFLHMHPVVGHPSRFFHYCDGNLHHHRTHSWLNTERRLQLQRQELATSGVLWKGWSEPTTSPFSRWHVCYKLCLGTARRMDHYSRCSRTVEAVRAYGRTNQTANQLLLKLAHACVLPVVAELWESKRSARRATSKCADSCREPRAPAHLPLTSLSRAPTTVAVTQECSPLPTLCTPRMLAIFCFQNTHLCWLIAVVFFTADS